MQQLATNIAKMTERLVAVLLVCVLTSYGVRGYYGTKYPLSGSWFKDRLNRDDLNKTLSTFNSLGGDTVLLRGAEFLNRTAESIKSDPLFKSCTDGKFYILNMYDMYK